MSDDRDAKEIDSAIAGYRREMDAEAALARRDLDEIEDHMRELIGELRATMPLAEAIAAARRRFGEPKAVAREHARVRTAFGAKLSRARAWSAVALLVPFDVVSMWTAIRQIHDASALFWSWFVGMMAISFGTYAALAARLSWGRAFVLGALPLTIAAQVVGVAWFDRAPWELASLAASMGALALIVPWRRDEVTWSAAGLALMAPAVHAATWMFAYFPPDGVSPITALGRMVAPIALLGVLAGCAGAMLRARWAALPSLMAAPCLAIGASVALQRGYRTAPDLPFFSLMVTTFIIGAACAALAALIQWRQAGSALGTLRSLR